jgi:hypothetical protein
MVRRFLYLSWFRAPVAVVVRSAFFWDIMHRRVVILYWHLGTICRSHLQGSKSRRRTERWRSDRRAVPRRLYMITTRRCIMFQKSADLILVLIWIEEIVMVTTRTSFCNIYKRLPTGWRVGSSKPGGGKIFLSCPGWLWGQPSLLYDGYWICFPGKKPPGHDTGHPPLSSVEVKERVELYVYSSPGDSWPVLVCTV